MYFLTKLAGALRVLGQILLAITVLAAPWCYGAVESWSQPRLFTGILISLILGLLVQLLVPTRQRFLMVMMIPIFLLIGLIALQLKPLSVEWLKSFSPHVVELREELLPSEQSDEYVMLQSYYPEITTNDAPATMSIYPAATRHLFSLFLLVIGTFVATALLFNSRKSVQLLVTGLALNGFVLAMMGIILKILNLKGGFIYTPQGGAYSSFLSKNTAGGYFCLCLGAGIAIILWSYFTSENYRTLQYLRERGDLSESISQRFFDLLSSMLSPKVLTYLLFTAIVIAGIFVSLSRSGCIAMIVSLFTGMLFLGLIKQTKLPLLALIVFFGFGILFVAWGGLNEKVADRLSTLFVEDTYMREMRPVNWKNAMNTVADYRGRGTGFGTYQYAVLQHDVFAATNQIFVHAENQYVEILTEMGYPGFFLFVLLLIISALAVMLLLRNKEFWHQSLGIGLVVVIVGQLVASLGDFGLYIPSNAMLFAMLVALSGVLFQEKPFFRKNLLFGIVNRAVPVVIALVMIFLVHRGKEEIVKVHSINQITKELKSINPKTGDLATMKNLTKRLEVAIENRPDSAMTLLTLLNAKVNLFRRLAYEEFLASPVRIHSNDNVLWGMTTLEHIHNQVYLWKGVNFKVPLNQLRSSPTVQEYIVPSFDLALRAREACPVIPQSHLFLAEISPLVDQQNTLQDFEKICIKRVTLCVPYSSSMQFYCGILEKNLRNWDQAYQYWKRSLELASIHLQNVVIQVKPFLKNDNAEDILEKVFPNTLNINFSLYAHYFPKHQYPVLYDLVTKRAEALLLDETNPIAEDQKYYYLGDLYFRQKKYLEAVKALEKAVRYSPENADWQFQLAQAYFEIGQYREAEKAIEQSVRLRPATKGYRDFAKKIKEKISPPRKR